MFTYIRRMWSRQQADAESMADSKSLGAAALVIAVCLALLALYGIIPMLDGSPPVVGPFAWGGWVNASAWALRRRLAYRVAHWVSMAIAAVFGLLLTGLLIRSLSS